MKSRPLVVALLVCIGLTTYTSFKLRRMTRIVGDANAITERVVRKTVEAGRRADVCFFWTPDRVQADCDYWENVGVGETIQIVTVDGERYVKGGDVYTSAGNFVFDIVLLVAEVIGVIVCAVMLFLRVRSRRERVDRR